MFDKPGFLRGLRVADAERPTDPPRWLWLWLPVGYPLFEMAVRAIDPEGEVYRRIFVGELGFVELATAALLVPAGILAARSAVRLRRKGAALAPGLLLAFVLGCLFLLGEEISYGQHIFNWESPGYFRTHNVQDETNLHNLRSFDKSLLKWLMMLGMLVVGIVLPLLILRRQAAPERLVGPALAPLLIRSTVCLPTAAIAIAMHVLVKALHALYDFEFHESGFVDLREMTELFVAFFLFLYALDLWRRVQAEPRRGPRDPGRA